MVQCGSSLGVRLVVGQRTLDPYAEVRILDPQPTSHEKNSGCYLPESGEGKPNLSPSAAYTGISGRVW